MDEGSTEPPRKKIYFCGSIRGGREDAALYRQLIESLKVFTLFQLNKNDWIPFIFGQRYGTVLTEHIGNEVMLGEEIHMSDTEIHVRDMLWLKEADFVIAEVILKILMHIWCSPQWIDHHPIHWGRIWDWSSGWTRQTHLVYLSGQGRGPATLCDGVGLRQGLISYLQRTAWSHQTLWLLHPDSC